jgi:hypothetical protein
MHTAPGMRSTFAEIALWVITEVAQKARARAGITNTPRGPYSPSLTLESRADHATPMCPKKMLWGTNPWNPERD